MLDFYTRSSCYGYSCLFRNERNRCIMSTKQTCFMCNGNGFRTVHEDITKTNVVLIQCSKCNSNGEAFILDQELHDKLKAEFERDYKPYLPTLADFVRQQNK